MSTEKETLNLNDMGHLQIPLAIVTAAFTVLAIALIRYTRRIRRMPAYFKSNFSLCKKSPMLTLAATIIYYALLALPIILLIIWVSIEGANNGANPTLPILFTFLFVVALVIPTPSNLFYIKILVVFILFVVAQLVTLTVEWSSNSQTGFFTLTAILLAINGIFVSSSLWLFDGSSWALNDYTSPRNKELIRETIEVWTEDETPMIVSGGVYYYISVRPTLRYILTVVLYALALVTLLTYSLVGHNHTQYGTIALINSICVITTDVIMIMIIFITRETNFNPITNSIAAMAVRALLVGFTPELWFLAYCFLYLILGTYLLSLIINKYYPTFEKLPSLTIEKRNIFAMPEIPTLILEIMFAGAIYFVATDDFKQLQTLSFVLDGVVYNFYVIGIAFALLHFSIFFYMISLRIVDRSRNRIRSVNFYYMGCEWCSEYYFFVFFAYGLLVILGFYMFAQTGSSFVWNSCVFLPLFYQALVLFYANWEENDFLLLGDVNAFNKKILKRKERTDKVKHMKTSVLKTMKIQGMSEAEKEEERKKQTMQREPEPHEEGQEMREHEISNINFLEGASVESNFMVEEYKGKTYDDWRESYGLVQAFREDKLLPTDKKIIITLFIMLLSLVGYSIVYTLSTKEATAVIVSVEIVFLFLTLIPMKRYFNTLERPNIGQIILFAAGIVLNYAFGVISYAAEWNREHLWVIWWAVVNVFILSLYAALALLRDKGLAMITYITCAVSVLLLVLTGVLVMTLFDRIAAGIAVIAVAVYYGYIMGLYFLYLIRNNSLPEFMHYITLAIIVVTCFAVMIYGFVSDDFDDFYGFSVTYLVINFLIIAYGGYSLMMDIYNRFDRPNFYSPHITPAFKYDPAVRSVQENIRPISFWLGGWLVFYGYCLLLQIFVNDTNVGIAVSSIFLVVVYLTYIYFSTYNVYKAGKMKEVITQKVIEESWNELLEIRDKNGKTDINIETLRKELEQYLAQADSEGMKVGPKNEESEIRQTQSEKDVNMVIHDLEEKLEKAVEDEEIALVNLWTRIMLKCDSAKKKKMMKFVNFIKEDGEKLAEIGIAMVVDDQLYDLESIYNQAFQEYNMLSPIQKIHFDKKFKEWVERKEKNQAEIEDLNKKEQEAQKKRQEELRRKLNQEEVDDSDKPVEQMRDSPLKMKKLCETLTSPYSDPTFEASSKNIPDMARSECKEWVRPGPDSIIFSEDTAMGVRQGYLGDCYLISAIGVLGPKYLRNILGIDVWKNADGAFMVKFKKYGKDVYIIIDSKFPSSGGEEWLFGRGENKKQIYTNILEKAYAKLYGGYQNIVGGKVSIALADMTGGFPEEIPLKKYQEGNLSELFNLMFEFKKQGYLMGAGSPSNPQGDAVDIDGIVQGHAYLIVDVRDLDGNQIIKLRNPHGKGGRESTLDWSDQSPKWTKRLLNLAGETMADDGAFWMGMEDFVYCYRAIYITRIFDDEHWRREGPINGQWKGQTAAGLPTKKFPTAKLSNNPHYGITVSKKATLFVELTQNESDENRKGKNSIFFMCQRNDGMRISSNSSNKLCGTSGSPINSVTVSSQVELSAPSYPYTFSLMVSAYQQGDEGTYSLNLYCNDLGMKVTDNSEFDV